METKVGNLHKIQEGFIVTSKDEIKIGDMKYNSMDNSVTLNKDVFNIVDYKHKIVASDCLKDMPHLNMEQLIKVRKESNFTKAEIIAFDRWKFSFVEMGLNRCEGKWYHWRDNQCYTNTELFDKWLSKFSLPLRQIYEERVNGLFTLNQVKDIADALYEHDYKEGETARMAVDNILQTKTSSLPIAYEIKDNELIITEIL